MKFRDLLNSDQLILVDCDNCSSKTPVDPATHALQRGIDADVADLHQSQTCPVCGSAEITLAAFSPLEKRREHPVSANAGA